MTLMAITDNRYMDDMLLAFDSISDLETVADESRSLFASRGFKLRKWIANSNASSILTNIPKCDLAKGIGEVDIGSQPIPDSKALGLIWDPECDRLRVKWDKVANAEVTTRRNLSSKLASLFDPLGMTAPYLLKGKLILQEVASSGYGWDDELPESVISKWQTWVDTLDVVTELSISRCCYSNSGGDTSNDSVVYQLHGFCDASNCAMSCVVYLRRIANDKSDVSFLLGKSRLVLTNQTNWVISRKELEAAKICSELMLLVSNALHSLQHTIHFWSDSQVVLKWIVNPDLHLARFVKRRIDKILLVSTPEDWNYVHTSANPADVGTRENSVKSTESVNLWLHGPKFLHEQGIKPELQTEVATVRSVSVGDAESSLIFRDKCFVERLVESCPDLYAVKKRAAYLIAFKSYMIAKFKKVEFKRPALNASFLDEAFLSVIAHVQASCFGAAIETLKNSSPDHFDTILKRLSSKVSDTEQMRAINELKTLRSLRPCVDSNSMFRVEGRLENASLPVEAKHPLILPGKHALTRLIVLDEHSNAGHAGPAYTLMRTRQRFWIINGISSVKRYLSECGKCAIQKAKPIRQLMADLPSYRVTAVNKPFKFCGTDYFGPLTFKQNRSVCKAWGLLFTCLCTRCVHVEIVTGLDLTNFVLAFSRFINLRGPVDTFFSDNGKTFCAAEKQLPELLESTEFHNAIRKRNVNWVRIPPYSPSQGGSWESMVKVFKKAFYQVMGDARRTLSLIELQTFISNAVRIINDRPLTSVSDKPNDLSSITPACFLGQQLAPNTPVSAFHEKGDLRRDFIYNATLARKFWEAWMKGYLPTLQGRNKWKTLQKNLTVGQLVLVGDSEDLSKRGSYRLGRIHCLHPQVRKGREVVRRATIAVLSHNPDTGATETKYILRDLSKIAPV